MKNVLIGFICLLASMSFAQSEPGHSKAIAELKKLNYDDYVAKKTGFDVSKCKFTKSTTGFGGEDAKFYKKTRAAANNGWPNDKVIYCLKIETPKDKDGITQRYTFTVVYQRSKCLTDGYGCLLLDEWHLVSTDKFGPFLEGAKEVTPDVVVSEVKSYFIEHKKEIIDGFTGYDMGDWIEFNEITYPTEGDYYNKQKMVSKTEKEAFAYVSGYKAVVEKSSDLRLKEIVKVNLRVKVILNLIDGAWQATEVRGNGYGDGKERTENTDPLEFYSTFENVSFEELLNKRVKKELPMETCGQHHSNTVKVAKEIYIMSGSGNENLKEYYINEEAYNKDVAFLSYLEERGFSYSIDSSHIECKWLPNGSYTQLKIMLSHPKVKGKVSKEMRVLLENNNYYYLTKGKSISCFFDLEFTLVDNKWKLNSWCEDVFKNYDPKIINN